MHGALSHTLSGVYFSEKVSLDQLMILIYLPLLGFLAWLFKNNLAPCVHKISPALTLLLTALGRAQTSFSSPSSPQALVLQWRKVLHGQLSRQTDGCPDAQRGWLESDVSVN